MTIYETITPAGALFTIQCWGTGHEHTSPDVPLNMFCPIHKLEWYWCGVCTLIWCPGQPPLHPAHQGAIHPLGEAAQLPAAN